MSASSPPRPPAARIGSLRGFLPLSDSTVSTRGQTLPSLIQNRSSGNAKDLRNALAQRRSVTPEVESDDEGDTERDVRGLDGPSPAKSRLGMTERRMSNGSQILMTPQMRSMRLIGNSNPRYQWWVISTLSCSGPVRGLSCCDIDTLCNGNTQWTGCWASRPARQQAD